MRAQTELPALGIAFVLLTAALVLGLAGANTAFSTADRDALERHAAERLSTELVSDNATITTRANVLDESAVETLNDSTFETAYTLPSNGAVAVELDGEVIARRGDVGGDASRIERIVLIENRTARRLRPEFRTSLSVTLPRRARNARLDISPPAGTVVRSVRANGRVVLANAAGLDGRFDLALSDLETTTLWFEAAGPLPRGSIEIQYDAIRTRKAILAVTVDA
jgi:hypothetical protein